MPAVASEYYDVIIDKGTLDAITSGGSPRIQPKVKSLYVAGLVN